MFLSEPIQNASKRILKRKSGNQKIFPSKEFLDSVIFGQNGQNSKKMRTSKNYSQNSFSRN